ncbi:MAG: hypothetical protein OXM54_11025 [Acidimicrobiaceae bacterium]|nr:hypothetical protein [Acidimicrobiaceae bacterium]
MSKIKGISIAGIREQFEFVDDPDAVERAQRNPALRAALRWLRPPNWHGSGLTPEQVLPIASESGIPVASGDHAVLITASGAASVDPRGSGLAPD